MFSSELKDYSKITKHIEELSSSRVANIQETRSDKQDYSIKKPKSKILYNCSEPQKKYLNNIFIKEVVMNAHKKEHKELQNLLKIVQKNLTIDTNKRVFAKLLKESHFIYNNNILTRVEWVKWKKGIVGFHNQEWVYPQNYNDKTILEKIIYFKELYKKKNLLLDNYKKIIRKLIGFQN